MIVIMKKIPGLIDLGVGGTFNLNDHFGFEASISASILFYNKNKRKSSDDLMEKSDSYFDFDKGDSPVFPGLKIGIYYRF